MAAINKRLILKKIIILCLLKRRFERRKRRCKKQFWVRKLYEERNNKGEFNLFSQRLSSNLGKESPDSIDSFTKLFDKTLNKHAPFKTIAIRGNSRPHLSKTLRKAIMLRTRLKNR